MGLLSLIAGKVLTGAKTLIQNAKVGKAATAAGYILPGTTGATTTQQQGTTSPGASPASVFNSIPTWLMYAGGGLLFLFFGWLLFFKRKRR